MTFIEMVSYKIQQRVQIVELLCVNLLKVLSEHYENSVVYIMVYLNSFLGRIIKSQDTGLKGDQKSGK